MSDLVERLRRMADMTTTGKDLLDIGRAGAARIYDGGDDPDFFGATE